VNVLDRGRWIRLWQTVGASGDPLLWFDRLTAAYSEQHRRYHNLRHIAECLEELDEARHLTDSPETIELAVWFHDAIYDPRASDNEERSASLAEQCLRHSGVGESIVGKVSRLVLATKHHDVGMVVDAPLLVDVDLSILGQPEKRFLEYEVQIRQEYAWVEETIFAEKRAEILKTFLARERIYSTPWFYDRYEQPARANLQSSVARLKNQGT
jgi:predicted metal-dependent HD superfamily phosphohydrolase